MEYRNLGQCGLKVPVLCLGAMTFGEADEKSFMHERRRGREDLVRHHEPRARSRASTSSTRPTSTARTACPSAWSARGWQSTRPATSVVLATKFRFRMGDRAERHRRVALPHRADRRGQPAAPPNRPHRPLPDPHAGHRHARGGDAARARRSRARGQGALPRRQQLRGVPARRQPVDRQDRAPASLRHAADAVQPRRARARARARPALPAVRPRHLALVAARGRLPERQVRRRISRRPPGRALEKWKERLADFDSSRNWRILDAVKAVASEKQTSTTAVALAGCSRSRRSRSVIFGARSLEQLDDNLKAADASALGRKTCRRSTTRAPSSSATPTSSWPASSRAGERAPREASSRYLAAGMQTLPVVPASMKVASALQVAARFAGRQVAQSPAAAQVLAQ